MTLLVGCTQEDSRSKPPPRSETKKDHFKDAYQVVQNFEAYDEDRARSQCQFSLTQWLKTEPVIEGWTSDPMLEDLSEFEQKLPHIESIQQTGIAIVDVEYLVGCARLRDAAKYVTTELRDPSVENWLPKEEGKKSFVDGDPQLASAARLFDWTVRQIDLDPLLDHPDDEGAAVGVEVEETPAPRRGIAGPGYMATPANALWTGHGDAIQRARVFIQLCRQIGIDACMLGFDDGLKQSRVRPWCAAVAIDNQLYLFDTSLGLPILNEAGTVATLAEVKADPKLLRKLDISGAESFTYPVITKQLDQVVALIDADLESMTMRMQMIQERLTGENQMEIYNEPTEIGKRITACEGVEKADLWKTPIETYLFGMGRQTYLSQNREELESHLTENLIFYKTGVAIGRRFHFQGKLENTPDEKGSKAIYLDNRNPDSSLEVLRTSRLAQKQVGIANSLSRDPEKRKKQLDTYIARSAQWKHVAGYCLAQAHYDCGSYEAAGNWFQRVRDATGESFKYAHGANYNFARSEEGQGNYGAARDLLYEDDESPQRHGNLLRARMLIKLEEKQAKD